MTGSTFKPDGKAKHLYLLPNEKTTTVAADSTLDTSKPPANPEKVRACLSKYLDLRRKLRDLPLKIPLNIE